MFCRKNFSDCAAPFFRDARIVAGIVTAVSLGALLGAYFFQYVVGLAPCVLCLYQRIPHAVIIVLGALGLVLAVRNHPKKTAFIVLLCALGFAVSTGLAFYHVGVEQRWWASAFEACSAPMSFNVDDLAAQLEKTPAVRCDAIAWQMFGISMAGYNALLSLLMTIYCAVAAVLVTRRANGF